MATNDSRQLNQEKRAAEKTLKAGAKGAKKTGKAAAKTGKKLWGVLPLKVKLIVIVITALTLIAVIVQGTASSSFTRTFRVNAVNEDNRYNIPKSDDEAEESMYNEDVARDDTVKLIEIIHEAKEKDMSSMDDVMEAAIEKKAAQLQKSGTPIDIELTKQNAKRETADASGYVYAPGGMEGVASGKRSESAQDVINGACAWAEAIAADNSFHYGTPEGGHHNGCYFCGTQPDSKKNSGMVDWEKTYCCNPFVHAAFAHGGGDPEMLKMCKKGRSYDWNSYASAPMFKSMGNLPISKLEKGDVLCMYGHVMLYIGNKKFAEAGGYGEDNNKKGSKSWNDSIAVTPATHCYSAVYRYIGKGGGTMDIPGQAAMAAVSNSSDGNTSHRSNNPTIQAAIDWAIEIANDDSWTYGPGYAGGCYLCGTRKQKHYTCMPFITAAYAHGGKVPEVLSLCERGHGFSLNMDKDWKDLISKGVFTYVGKCSDLNFSDLQPGDIMVQHSYDDQHGHMNMYIGGNDLVEAASFGFGPNSICVQKGRAKSWFTKLKNGSSQCGEGDKNFVMRYTGGSAGSQYTKKDELTILDEISANTGKRHSIGYVNGTDSNCAQSFAYVGNKFAVAYVDTNHPPGYVQLVEKNGRKKGVVRCDDILHANAACATHDGKFMVAGRLGGNRNAANIFSVNGDSVSSDGEKGIPVGASSIAYDRETDTYCLKVGMNVHLYDRNFNKKSVVSCTYHGNGTFYQDMGAGGGFIFCCFTAYGSADSEDSGDNFIDIYNESTGDYCGTYKVNYGELESCDVVDGELVLLVHISGYVNYIHFTGIKVNSGLGAFGNQSAISVLDMDILAAYNISLSNTDMFLNAKDIKDEGSKDGWRNDDAYRDISGKKLPIYWFGANRGMINYEKDLRKKLDPFIKGSPVSTDYNASLRGSGKVAEIAEQLAWPYGTNKSKYRVSSGGSATPAFREVQKKWYPNRNDLTFACCCHSAGVVLSEATNKRVGNLLPNVESASEAKSILEDSTKGTGAVVLRWDGNMNSLQRGDICVAALKSGGGHVFIWLGDGRIVNGHRADSQRSYLCTEDNNDTWTGDISDYDYYCIVRLPAEGTSTGKQQGLETSTVGSASSSSAGASSASSKKAADSKHFYRVVIGSNPEPVDGSDENGNSVTKYILPVTVKECDVEDLMDPLFDVSPQGDYTNSKTIKTAKIDEAEKSGTQLKEGEVERLLRIPGGTATNLEAAYSLSDNTGRMIFGNPQVAMKESGVYGTGSLKLPLPPGSFSVTSHFTNGQLRTDVNTGRSHDGVDLGAPSGTPIYASLPGTVKLAKYNGGFGNCVIVESGDYQIIYGHMSKILCRQGDTVQLGALIGKVGSTGNSTGPHLHFEVRKNGQLIDPEPLLGLK